MAETILFIVNDPPYGTERPYNALRLAGAVAKKGGDVRGFLMGDAVGCAISGQKLPDGYYKLAGCSPRRSATAHRWHAAEPALMPEHSQSTR